MVALQVSDNTNGIKADLQHGQDGVPGALPEQATNKLQITSPFTAKTMEDLLCKSGNALVAISMTRKKVTMNTA